MTVSLIVPVHNGRKYLAEALQSALAGSLVPEEIWVVDDGSSDDSVAVARSFAQVRVLRQEQAGAGAARQRGIESSSGELLAFLDADDVWTPDKLFLQSEFLKKHPDVDGVFGAAQQFQSPDWDGDSDLELRSIPCKLPSTLLVRRCACVRAGSMNSHYRAGEFIDWCLRAEESGCRFEMLPELVLHRRLHAGNHGRTQPQSRQDYARIVAEALRRRRQAGGS